MLWKVDFAQYPKAFIFKQCPYAIEGLGKHEIRGADEPTDGVPFRHFQVVPCEKSITPCTQLRSHPTMCHDFNGTLVHFCGNYVGQCIPRRDAQRYDVSARPVLVSSANLR